MPVNNSEKKEREMETRKPEAGIKEVHSSLKTRPEKQDTIQDNKFVKKKSVGFSKSKPEEILSRRLEEPVISEQEYDSDEEFNYKCFVTMVQNPKLPTANTALEEGRKNLRKKKKQIDMVCTRSAID